MSIESSRHPRLRTIDGVDLATRTWLTDGDATAVVVLRPRHVGEVRTTPTLSLWRRTFIVVASTSWPTTLVGMAILPGAQRSGRSRTSRTLPPPLDLESRARNTNVALVGAVNGSECCPPTRGLRSGPQGVSWSCRVPPSGAFP